MIFDFHPRAHNSRIDDLPAVVGFFKMEGRGVNRSMESVERAIYTIGHSTLEINAFVKILKHYQIMQLIDVRTIPRSRHNPQFNRDALGPFLRNRRINYRHMKDLGGLRRPVADSVNSGWRNASFRGFADYMQTREFTDAIEKLCLYANKKTTAIMCAEAVPWRCHRSLIADALLVRGYEIRDIYSHNSLKNHVLTAMARVEGTSITYPEAP